MPHLLVGDCLDFMEYEPPRHEGIKKKYECKKIREELDELIKDSSNLFDDVSKCMVSGANVQKMERFETVILDHLLEKTNFENAFSSIKASYGSTKEKYTVIYTLLCQLRQKQLDPTFSNFLKIIDGRLKNIKQKPIGNIRIMYR